MKLEVLKWNSSQMIRIVHRILDHLGYYCYHCGRYKKRFSPPFGKDACLECLLDDVCNHNNELSDLVIARDQGIITDDGLYDGINRLKDKYLPSRSERKV